MTATTAPLTHSGNTTGFRRGLILGALATAILWLALLAAVVLASFVPSAQAPTTQPAPGPVQIVDENHPIERPGGVKVF